jgi:predicted amidohydrolase
MITDPWGETIVAAGNAEAIITAVIDVDSVNEIRKEYTFLNDIIAF